MSEDPRMKLTMSGETDPLLKVRASTHGDYSEQALTGERLRATMLNAPNWASDLSGAHRDALLMISVKLSRILAGNPNVKDHWDDIAGYAKLAADRCGTPTPAKAPGLSPDDRFNS